MEHNLKPKVLYLSYNGILEPLGHSQVLNYVLELSDSFQITLMSFEKREDLRDVNATNKISYLCKMKGIKWVYLPFNKSPFYSKFNFLRYFVFAIKIIDKQTKIIHARSFLPSLTAYVLSFIYNYKYIYDMRGYWIEEKIDVGRLKRSSLHVKILKTLKKNIIKRASHIVTLSNVSKSYINKSYNTPCEIITTIYTCTDLNKFKLREQTHSDNIIFGYTGTTVGWYLFDQTLDFIRTLFGLYSKAHFKLITRDNHDLIIQQLKAKNIDINRVILKSVQFENIQEEYMDIDYAIFFINPSFSKTASMPTKFGEFLAAGIPCIINQGIGDTSHIVQQYPYCGYLVSDFNDLNYKNVINAILNSKNGIETTKCREVAEKHFSLKSGAEQYKIIYKNLIE